MSTRRNLSRRGFIVGASRAAAGLGIAGAASTFAAAPGKRRPNVLFIITDQQHADAIGATGNSHLRTPALDALAAEGLRFDLSYTANPVCSPARSCLFTGRPSSETGVHTNGRRIREGMPNLGEWLAAEGGYETLYAGKWHVPGTHQATIPGFRVLTTGIGGQGNLGDTATSAACAAYLRNRSREKPFFMVASFLQPHDICEWLRLNSRKQPALPYAGLRDALPPLPENTGFDPREPATIQDRRSGNEGVANDWNDEQWRYYIWSYYRHVEMADAEIGRVLTALADSGYADDTLVVFTSDHGEGCAHHRTTRKNSLYDEAARVPLILRLPGSVPEGAADSRHVVSGLDVLPTVCSFAGVGLPADVRGTNLRPLWERQEAQGPLFRISEVLNNRGRMVRTPEFKYIVYSDDPVDQLFDMRSDPGELLNLAPDARFADVRREHRDLLAAWERTLDPAPNVPQPGAFRLEG